MTGGRAGRGLRRLRLLLWCAATRRRFARLGVPLEFAVGPGVTYDTLPAVELTRQQLADDTGTPERVRVELGAGAHLGRGLVLEIGTAGAGRLELGPGAICFAGVRIILFGGTVTVGAGTRLRDGVTLKSSGRLTIGAHGFVNTHSIVHCAQEVELGEHPQVAERVTIIDSDHRADGSDTYIQLLPIATGPVRVGRNVWIGAGAVVLRGAVLGPNAVVGAGSIVRAGEYAGGWLIAGAPAQARRPLAASPDGA